MQSIGSCAGMVSESSIAVAAVRALVPDRRESKPRARQKGRIEFADPYEAHSSTCSKNLGSPTAKLTTTSNFQAMNLHSPRRNMHQSFDWRVVNNNAQMMKQVSSRQKQQFQNFLRWGFECFIIFNNVSTALKGWTMHYTEQGAVYYYNSTTGEYVIALLTFTHQLTVFVHRSTWTRPT